MSVKAVSVEKTDKRVELADRTISHAAKAVLEGFVEMQRQDGFEVLSEHKANRWNQLIIPRLEAEAKKAQAKGEKLNAYKLAKRAFPKEIHAYNKLRAKEKKMFAEKKEKKELEKARKQFDRARGNLNRMVARTEEKFPGMSKLFGRAKDVAQSTMTGKSSPNLQKPVAAGRIAGPVDEMPMPEVIVPEYEMPEIDPDEINELQQDIDTMSDETAKLIEEETGELLETPYNYIIVEDDIVYTGYYALTDIYIRPAAGSDNREPHFFAFDGISKSFLHLRLAYDKDANRNLLFMVNSKVDYEVAESEEKGKVIRIKADPVKTGYRYIDVKPDDFSPATSLGFPDLLEDTIAEAHARKDLEDQSDD